MTQLLFTEQHTDYNMIQTISYCEANRHVTRTEQYKLWKTIMTYKT